jgi:hypothetical protein
MCDDLRQQFHNKPTIANLLDNVAPCTSIQISRCRDYF